MLKKDYRLWIDDQLDDPDVPARHCPPNYAGAKSSAEAIALVEKYGPPFFMDLDHDLSGDDDVTIFLRWLAEHHFESPPAYRVHSENPEGRKSIVSFMESWKKVLEME